MGEVELSHTLLPLHSPSPPHYIINGVAGVGVVDNKLEYIYNFYISEAPNVSVCLVFLAGWQKRTDMLLDGSFQNRSTTVL